MQAKADTISTNTENFKEFPELEWVDPEGVVFPEPPAGVGLPPPDVGTPDPLDGVGVPPEVGAGPAGPE
jgi:hypothetical protein